MDSTMDPFMPFDELVLTVTSFDWPEYSGPLFPEYTVVEEPSVTFEWPENSGPLFPEYTVVEEPSSPVTTTTPSTTTPTTNTTTTTTTTTITTTDDNADKSNVAPSKRGRGRPKKQPGAPKGPYVKKADKPPAKPKCQYNKHTAGPPDMNNNAIATKETVAAALKKKTWYGGSGDEMFKKA
ncbi:hypothetical protein MMC07_000840 [Pseudocyphellaria aurata]|nr:hypothetical protein [Pseudocyphellaria aurata]